MVTFFWPCLWPWNSCWVTSILRSINVRIVDYPVCVVLQNLINLNQHVCGKQVNFNSPHFIYPHRTIYFKSTAVTLVYLLHSLQFVHLFFRQYHQSFYHIFLLHSPPPSSQPHSLVLHAPHPSFHYISFLSDVSLINSGLLQVSLRQPGSRSVRLTLKVKLKEEQVVEAERRGRRGMRSHPGLAV